MDTEPCEKRDVIEVWRPHDLKQLEVRRGFSVARPVPRHWHEEYQLCLIQSGSGDLSYRNSKFLTPPASLFIVHPGEVHSNSSFDSFGVSYRMIFVETEIILRAAKQVYGKENADLPFFPTTVIFDGAVIKHFIELHIALELSSSSLERQSLLLIFLSKLIMRFAGNRPLPRAFGSEKQVVKRTFDYLAAHSAENISLENLASISNLSPFHFNRVFSEEFGMPPHAVQTQLRILQAKALLKQGCSISQTAFQTGFADQSHLTRHFKRLTGVTPGQFIQNSKNVQYRK